MTNVPGRGYCFVAPVDRAASAYTQRLYVEEICHANGSTLLLAAERYQRREPSAIATSAEFLRSYKKQAHETIDAMTAVVINAQAALNWLRAQPQDLEGVQQALNKSLTTASGPVKSSLDFENS